MNKLNKINVAVLDDHTTIVDGYRYRISSDPTIEIVASAVYGDDLMPMLLKHKVDVLILDVGVYVNENNQNNYSIVNAIFDVKELYPEIVILVISMYKQKALINTLMDAGASGYIVKDDTKTIHSLNKIIKAISTGGIYFSQDTFTLLNQENLQAEIPVLSRNMLKVLSMAAAHPDFRMEDIAEALSMAPSTVRNTFSRAYGRLRVKSRIAAVEKAKQLGILPSSIEDLTNQVIK